MKSAAALPLGLCAIAIGLGLSVSWLPAPLPVDGPVTEFSAVRAWQHVSAIARQPHPATSEENRRVRAYLVKSMTELGLTVRELPGKQEGTALGNLYAELPATAGGQPAILLVSHYDSVPAGPGAASGGERGACARAEAGDRRHLRHDGREWEEAWRAAGRGRPRGAAMAMPAAALVGAW